MPRDARLALAKHLGKLSDRELQMFEQPHDPKPRRIRQCTGDRLDLHARHDMRILLYAQEPT
jgi:hypothetical protein